MMTDKRIDSGENAHSTGLGGAVPSPYDGPLGMEEDDDLTGGDIEAKNTALEVDEELLPGILAEEEPYLGWDGMAGEQDYDLIDMRDDAEPGRPTAAAGPDAFTDSMDVFGEDLENYTEDLDEDIDAALTSPEEDKRG